MTEMNEERDLAGDAEAQRRRESAWRIVALVVSLVFVLVPMLLIRYPPILDLPQQLHQVVLAKRVLAGLEPELDVRWLGANKLGYLIFGLARALGGDSWAPRLAAVMTGLLWVGSVHLLSWRLNRGIANTLLASVLLLGSAFYAGFFNFLTGIAGLTLWMVELDRDPARSSSTRLVLGSATATALLFLAHALWFAFGMVLVGSVLLLRRFSLRETLLRGLGALPIALLALVWTRRFGAIAWQTSTWIGLSPLERVGSLRGISTLLLGGLRSNVEVLFAVVWLAFVAVGMIAWARGDRRGVSGLLFCSGAFLLACAIGLPEKIDKTMLFASRWAPFGACLLVMSVPEPPVRRWLSRALAMTVCASLSVATAVAWLEFDRRELAGFEEVLAQVETGSSVMGLDFLRKSRYLRVDPFFQLFAYAGVERAAHLNFDFSHLGTGIVVRRDLPWWPPWVSQLEWNPGWVSAGDIAYFDYLLVHSGPRELASAMARARGSRLVDSRGAWHLVATHRTATAPGGGG